MADRHLVSEAELRAAFIRAIQALAPIGGDREIPFNDYCDCLLGLLADFLVAAPEAHSAEELVTTFRAKLTAALAQRQGVAGHA